MTPEPGVEWDAGTAAAAAVPAPRRFGALVAVLLVVGLYGGMIGMARAARPEPPAAGPPPTSEMAMRGDAPALQLGDLTASVAVHYRHAADHGDLYRQVPCYCGCDSFADHANLFDCFVRADGGWEAHAAGCGICLAEAEEVRRLRDAGHDPGRIRDAIIEQFGPSTNPAA